MSDELKPCPWPDCGENAARGEEDEDEDRDIVYRVRCGKCGRKVEGASVYSRHDAAAAWNALPRESQWTTYDGTEETLPDKGTLGALLLSRKEPKTGLRVKDVVWRVSAGWLNDRCQEYPYSVGDRWRYWPKEDDNDY